MRFSLVTILTGSLVFGGHAFAQSHASNAPAQMTAPADRATYIQKARSDLAGWQQKMDDFGARAKAKGHEASTAAGKDLDAAWTATKAGAGKLQTVGAEGWMDAKTSYESASRDLARTWAKIRPEDK